MCVCVCVCMCGWLSMSIMSPFPYSLYITRLMAVGKVAECFHPCCVLTIQSGSSGSLRSATSIASSSSRSYFHASTLCCERVDYLAPSLLQFPICCISLYVYVYVGIYMRMYVAARPQPKHTHTRYYLDDVLYV